MQVFRRRKSDLNQQNNSRRVSVPLPLAAPGHSQPLQETPRSPVFERFARSGSGAYSDSNAIPTPTTSKHPTAAQGGPGHSSARRNVFDDRPPPPPKDLPTSKLIKSRTAPATPSNNHHYSNYNSTPRELTNGHSTKVSRSTGARGYPPKLEDELTRPPIFTHPDASHPRSSQERLIDEIHVINRLFDSPIESPSSPPFTPKRSSIYKPSTSTESSGSIPYAFSPLTPDAASPSKPVPESTLPRKERLEDETDLYSGISSRYSERFSSPHDSPLPPSSFRPSSNHQPPNSGPKRSLDAIRQQPKFDGLSHRPNKSTFAAVDPGIETPPSHGSGQVQPASILLDGRSSRENNFMEKYNLPLKDRNAAKVPVVLPRVRQEHSITPSMRTSLTLDRPSTPSRVQGSSIPAVPPLPMSEKARHQAPSPILPKNVPPTFTSREAQGSAEATRTKPPGKNVLVSKRKPKQLSQSASPILAPESGETWTRESFQGPVGSGIEALPLSAGVRRGKGARLLLDDEFITPEPSTGMGLFSSPLPPQSTPAPVPVYTSAAAPVSKSSPPPPLLPSKEQSDDRYMLATAQISERSRAFEGPGTGAPPLANLTNMRLSFAGDSAPREFGATDSGSINNEDGTSTVTGTFKTAMATFSSTIRQSPSSARNIDEFGSRRPGGRPLRELPSPNSTINFNSFKKNASATEYSTMKSSPPSPPSPSTSKVSYKAKPARPKWGIQDFGHRSRALPRPPSMASRVQPPALEPTRQLELSFDRVKTYPLLTHLASLSLFTNLLQHLTFIEYLTISFLTTASRHQMEEHDFREAILERYLGGVGYWRWSRIFGSAIQEVEEPIDLTLQDLNCYMRAVSIPPHRFSDYAQGIIATHHRGAYGSSSENPNEELMLYAMVSRSYTRVILRLRAQAEAEAEFVNSASNSPQSTHSPLGPAPAPSSYPSPNRNWNSRPSSRAGSVVSNDRKSISHVSLATSLSNNSHHPGRVTRLKFRSPLYRPKHAPLLRVFVLSPEGAWMSDNTILNCEAELKRACMGAKGRMAKKLLRSGDVVWNCAISDEANLGRSIWDGNFLIDLDYTFTKMGAIPRYLHSLSFPPSYFHKIIRCGSGVEADPIVQIDISPFGEQISTHLQLLQERVAMDTPQGGRHTVLRWTHRSYFKIPAVYRSLTHLNMPIPNTSGTFVHADWIGTVVVEAEGTNEGLAELQARCGTAFTQFRKPNIPINSMRPETGRVFRLLRERSKPGEIWIRAVREKDRVM